MVVVATPALPTSTMRGTHIMRGTPIAASLEYIDRSLLEATPLIFATLIDQTPDKNGKVSHLIITRAERQRLLVVLSLHFGQKLDLENQSYIVSSTSVLKSYLLKYKCSDEP
jgi:hypothetical protein